MCGIAGYVAFGNMRPDKAKLEKLFVSLSGRGTDASGIAYYNGKQVIVAKSALASGKFVKTKYWADFNPSANRALLMHTRWSTGGSPSNPMNNHPLVGKNCVLAHNGIVHNDRELVADDERTAEVDSAALLHIMDIDKEKWSEKEAVEKVFDLVDGSWATAVMYDADNDSEVRLVLFRHISPLWFGMIRGQEILYFASESQMISNLFKRKSIRFHGWKLSASPVTIWELQDENAIWINEKGKIHEETFVARAPSYYGRGGSSYLAYGSADDWDTPHKNYRDWRKQKEFKEVKIAAEPITWNCPECQKSNLCYSLDSWHQCCWCQRWFDPEEIIDNSVD